MRTLVIIKRIIESNFKRLSFPYKLTFATTYKCNSRCMTCNIWKKTSVRELTTEQIRIFFQNNNKFSWINLTGGEFLLRKDANKIFDIVNKYCKNLHTLNITTNGFATDLIIDKVSKMKTIIPNFIIVVSLDGHSQTHDKIRGIKNSWVKAIETFKKARELNIRTFFGFTLSKYNTGEFINTYKAIKKQIQDFNIKDLHVNIANYSEHYLSNLNTKLINKSIVDELHTILKIKTKLPTPESFLENRYLVLAEKYFQTGKSPLRCKALSSSCFINPKGDVFPCSIFNAKLGNIINSDFKTIWNSEKSKLVLKQIEDNKCLGCWTPCEAFQSILGNLV